MSEITPEDKVNIYREVKYIRKLFVCEELEAIKNRIHMSLRFDKDETYPSKEAATAAQKELASARDHACEIIRKRIEKIQSE